MPGEGGEKRISFDSLPEGFLITRKEYEERYLGLELKLAAVGADIKIVKWIIGVTLPLLGSVGLLLLQHLVG